MALSLKEEEQEEEQEEQEQEQEQEEEQEQQEEEQEEEQEQQREEEQEEDGPQGEQALPASSEEIDEIEEVEMQNEIEEVEMQDKIEEVEMQDELQDGVQPLSDSEMQDSAPAAASAVLPLPLNGGAVDAWLQQQSHLPPAAAPTLWRKETPVAQAHAGRDRALPPKGRPPPLEVGEIVEVVAACWTWQRARVLKLEGGAAGAPVQMEVEIEVEIEGAKVLRSP